MRLISNGGEGPDCCGRGCASPCYLDMSWSFAAHISSKLAVEGTFQYLLGLSKPKASV